MGNQNGSVAVRFTWSRDTKGTHRYDEIEEPNRPPTVGGLYVRKGTFPTGAPAALTVTLEAAS